MKDSEHPDHKYYELAAKWRNGTITPQEEKEFSDWYNSSQDAPVIIPASFASSEEKLKSRIWNRVQKGKSENNKGAATRYFIYKMAAAAVITAVLLGFYLSEKRAGLKENTSPAIVRSSMNANPHIDRAVLTLSDGTQVSLDDAGNGSISLQGNTQVIKLTSGRLAYKLSKTQHPAPVTAFNSIRTPRGGKYEVVLPDGTKVWLNASSSIRFPVEAIGREREITLNGEAYFEVARDKSKPFIVNVDEMKVVVLGTHFNIMAYKEEQEVKTTLLEGSVEIHSGKVNTKLDPGQQAQLKKGFFKLIKNVNIDEVMAWKKGEFHFEDTRLQTIMRQIERWYDVEIVYEGNLADIRLSGIISQKEDVSQLLEILEATHQIKCRVQGKTIIVAPY